MDIIYGSQELKDLNYSLVGNKISPYSATVQNKLNEIFRKVPRNRLDVMSLGELLTVYQAYDSLLCIWGQGITGEFHCMLTDIDERDKTILIDNYLNALNDIYCEVRTNVDDYTDSVIETEKECVRYTIPYVKKIIKIYKDVKEYILELGYTEEDLEDVVNDYIRGRN